eukprot:jgi/Ulvmu1/3614/UM017_0026.1
MAADKRLDSQQDSVDGHSSNASSSLPVTDSTQLLRLETIKDCESRRVILAMKSAILLGASGAIVLGVIKETRGRDLIVMNRNFFMGQVVCFSIMLAVLVGVFIAWSARVINCHRRGMIWSRKRSKTVQASMVRATVIFIIVAGQLFVNIHLWVDPSSFCTSRILQPVINGAVWICWNTLLCLLVIESHNTNLLPLKAGAHGHDATVGSGHDATVESLPVTAHWPKLLIWIPCTALEVWIAAMGIQDGHTIETTVGGGGSCTWGAELECRISQKLYGATIGVLCATAIYFALYAIFLMRAWRQLGRQLYQKFRVLNMIMRLQFRFNGSMVLALIIGMTLTWYVGSDACVNYTVTWYGNPPVTFIIVCLQLVSFNLTFPRRHNTLAAQHVMPASLLQQFAWTEADVPRKLAARLQAVDSSCSICPNFLAKPLFCFETAIKLFFWSALIYSYTETSEVPFETMPAPIKALIGEMRAAMRLFRLCKRHLFYDRAHGTKVLVAWNSSTILVTVRGSAEVANYLQDARFLQTAHPPKRKFKGRTPRVHSGFLATWRANGIRTRVLAHIAALLDSADDRSAVRVLCTGHSLGGAVAQLASFDIARELGVSPRNIKVYTYGCPRIGNHAFACEVCQVAPDTWHIIHDQDVVTQAMKLLGLYKRAGQRVVVTRRGDLIVRPNHFETSLLQNVRGGRAGHHFTVPYQQALIAVVTAQLRASSRHEGGLHGLLGLLKGVPQVRTALEAHAEQLGTSLVDLARGTAAALTADARHAAASASQSLTPSRHASLLRALGDGGSEAAAVGAPESPRSCVASEAEAVAVALPGVMADVGDAPTMLVADAEGAMEEQPLAEPQHTESQQTAPQHTAPQHAAATAVEGPERVSAAAG